MFNLLAERGMDSLQFVPHAFHTHWPQTHCAVYSYFMLMFHLRHVLPKYQFKQLIKSLKYSVKQLFEWDVWGLHS